MASRNNTGGYEERLGLNDPRDTVIQIVLSAVLGLGAFISFCILRPRWTALYAARRQQKGEAQSLPEMPDSMFGWIVTLWRITEQQVLASAGLDAYVFLTFFRMATKFLAVTLFFALVVIKPVHDAFPDRETSISHPNGTRNDTAFSKPYLQTIHWSIHINKSKKNTMYDMMSSDYLWMYLVFAYVFTALAIYLVVTETVRIIAIRQAYLGNQSTITDKTIRLSGIPPELRSEEKIKAFIEDLQIGKVESVMLCRNWKELDDAMARRMNILRKLEEAWTVYYGQRRVERNLESLPISQPAPPGPGSPIEDDEESGPLLGGENGHTTAPYGRDRPTTKIRFGFLKLQGRKVDAIDYYEEKLRKLDEHIQELRKKVFDPTPLAFVTMDSVASCQMAAQAVLDPSPLTLIANQSPSPEDVVWQNTYMPRSHRMTRAWIVTVMITILTIFWSLLLAPVATALNLEAIHRVWPELAHTLKTHYFARSLVTTQLPTLLVTLLFVAVPYLYDWLANMQGMISQGDVQLSVISKNFFFAFFNYFIIFTVLGTYSNFLNFFEKFQDSLKDTTRIAYTLAQSLQGLLTFYTNLIVLQGIGLFPFRLLEFGSVALYPIYRLGAKTPRDFAELVQPPIFNYGFYLPQVLLIFIICITYSILRESWRVLLSGLIYFLIGGFVYKYQLLYAMDHRQYSTGRAWVMICNRIILGLVLFQLTTAGQLALKGAFKRSIGIAPLIIGTVWFSYIYSRSYTPLMEHIALSSIERRPAEAEEDEGPTPDPDGWAEEAHLRYEAEAHGGETVEEQRVKGMRFINPSLIIPLEGVWIADGV